MHLKPGLRRRLIYKRGQNPHVYFRYELRYSVCFDVLVRFARPGDAPGASAPPTTGQRRVLEQPEYDD